MSVAAVFICGYGQYYSAYPIFSVQTGGLGAAALQPIFLANTCTIVLAQPLVLRLVTGRCRSHAFALSAAEHHMIVFDLIAVVCGLQTLIHVDGVVRRTQPWTETVEIGLYAALCGASVVIRVLLPA
ncbi:hypothetical protein ACQP2K_29660 [Microbispora siamensis]